MDAQQSTKKHKKPWRCFKCKDADKVICKHLEAKLPKMSTTDIKGNRWGANIDNLQEPDTQTLTPNEKELKFREKLFKFGLDEFHVNVLTAKLFYGWTDKEVAEFLHIPNVRSVYYQFKKACDLLKERGYK